MNLDSNVEDVVGPRLFTTDNVIQYAIWRGIYFEAFEYCLFMFTDHIQSYARKHKQKAYASVYVCRILIRTCMHVVNLLGICLCICACFGRRIFCFVLFRWSRLHACLENMQGCAIHHNATKTMYDEEKNEVFIDRFMKINLLHLMKHLM